MLNPDCVSVGQTNVDILRVSINVITLEKFRGGFRVTAISRSLPVAHLPKLFSEVTMSSSQVSGAEGKTRVSSKITHEMVSRALSARTLEGVAMITFEAAEAVRV
jgi:hypothetical protein